MRHKVTLNMQFIIEREEDLTTFDSIAEAMRDGFKELSSYEYSALKFNMDIESMPSKFEDIIL